MDDQYFYFTEIYGVIGLFAVISFIILTYTDSVGTKIHSKISIHTVSVFSIYIQISYVNVYNLYCTIKLL